MKSFISKTYLWIVALPYALILLGAASNQLVLIANGGKFPVMVNEYALPDNPKGMFDAEHCVMTGSTRLNALADIFHFGTEVDSIGDLTIDLGGFLQPLTVGAWFVLVSKKLTA